MRIHASVGVEASGGYEAALVSELVERGQAVPLVNPTRVRAFARAEGFLAKTDKFDARLIAHFGPTMQPEPQTRREQAQLALNQWVTRRRQRGLMVTAEKNRLQTVPEAIQIDLVRHMEWMQAE